MSQSDSMSRALSVIRFTLATIPTKLRKNTETNGITIKTSPTQNKKSNKSVGG